MSDGFSVKDLKPIVEELPVYAPLHHKPPMDEIPPLPPVVYGIANAVKIVVPFWIIVAIILWAVFS